MQYVKSQVIDFDSKFERQRVAQYFSGDQAQSMLAVLDALDSGNLEAASRLYTPDVASRMPSAPYAIIKAYRDSVRAPGEFEHPRLRTTSAGEFVNPNDVRAQHAYALHVLHSHRYMMAKMAVVLQKVGGDDPEVQNLVQKVVKTLDEANGAAENDAFRLTNTDGQLALSLD